MSSSSAYNNVLLKQTVQTQAVAAPKRDIHNDHSSADFTQTFQDVSNSTQRKIDEPVKSSAAKKAAHIDQTRQKAETGDTRKLIKEKLANEKLDNQKLDRENISRKNADEKIEKDKLVKESHAKEDAKAETANTADHTSKSKKSGDKLNSSKDSKKTEESRDELVVSADSIAVAPTSMQESDSSALSLTLVTPVDGSTSEMTSAVANSDVESVANVSGSALSGKSDLAALAASELASESSPVEVDSDTDTSVALDAQSDILSADGSQLLAAESSKVMEGKTAGEIAEAQSAAVNMPAPKRSITESFVSDSPLNKTSEVSEQNADALLDASDAIMADKALAPSTKDASVSKTDVNQIDVTEDPKTVFEKMLQTVSKSVVREEGTTASPLQNSTSNSSPSLADSFARFNDTQSPSTRSFVVQTAIPVPVGQPQWSQAVGEKVLWLAAQNVSSAEINLHPKDLGPMQVKVSVNQEQTSVSFTSHHPLVREVLDQNLNRLRDMFSEQGLNLVNVDVSDKSFSRQQGEGKEQKGHSGANSVNEEESVAAVTTIVQQRLVDHYA